MNMAHRSCACGVCQVHHGLVSRPPGPQPEPWWATGRCCAVLSLLCFFVFFLLGLPNLLPRGTSSDRQCRFLLCLCVLLMLLLLLLVYYVIVIVIVIFIASVLYCNRLFCLCLLLLLLSYCCVVSHHYCYA